jgi:hypothetical protein
MNQLVERYLTEGVCCVNALGKNRQSLLALRNIYINIYNARSM